MSRRVQHTRLYYGLPSKEQRHVDMYMCKWIKGSPTATIGSWTKQTVWYVGLARHTNINHLGLPYPSRKVWNRMSSWWLVDLGRRSFKLSQRMTRWSCVCSWRGNYFGARALNVWPLKLRSNAAALHEYSNTQVSSTLRDKSCVLMGSEFYQLSLNPLIRHEEGWLDSARTRSSCL